MFHDRNADKNNANHGQRLVFAATEVSCPTQRAIPVDGAGGWPVG